MIPTKIKNYTSTVPAERTIAAIEIALAEFGATGTRKEFANGKPVAMSFTIAAPSGGLVDIRMPVDVEVVYAILCERARGRRKSAINKQVAASIRAQAERTAWRIQYDWLTVTLTQILMRQIETLQAFFPHIVKDGQTLYSVVAKSNFALLAPPSGHLQ